MKRSLSFALILGCVLLSLAIRSQAESRPGWTVYLRHVGQLWIGVPLDEVRQQLGDPSAELDTPGSDANSCAYLTSTKLPEGLALMFVDGRLARIDIRSKDIRTASGVGVGDTEAAIQRTYPEHITVDPHKYVDGHYLRYIPKDAADQAYEMLFETDQDKVTRYRIGYKEQVAWVEGCL